LIDSEHAIAGAAAILQSTGDVFYVEVIRALSPTSAAYAADITVDVASKNSAKALALFQNVTDETVKGFLFDTHDDDEGRELSFESVVAILMQSAEFAARMFPLMLDDASIFTDSYLYAIGDFNFNYLVSIFRAINDQDTREDLLAVLNSAYRNRIRTALNQG
ncbi:MAG: hypothetical protein AAFZ92_09885, partial [Pseudomonadota bacterium]